MMLKKSRRFYHLHKAEKLDLINQNSNFVRRIEKKLQNKNIHLAFPTKSKTRYSTKRAYSEYLVIIIEIKRN